MVGPASHGVHLMLISFEVGSRKYTTDLSRGVSLAIPLRFNGPQPNFFGVAPAQAKPTQSGDFVGDISKGGSCNVQSYSFTPHCNGTHTECIGHMVSEKVSVAERLPPVPIPATL